MPDPTRKPDRTGPTPEQARRRAYAQALLENVPYAIGFIVSFAAATALLFYLLFRLMSYVLRAFR